MQDPDPWTGSGILAWPPSPCRTSLTKLPLITGVPVVQDGVPEAIQTLIEGGMRVWMITGDKQETAINIGISCGLITDPAHIQVRTIILHIPQELPKPGSQG